MIVLEHNKQKINVPQSWGDVTLELYESVYQLAPETHRERVEVVAKICGTNAETLLNWPAEIFSMIVEYVDFIFRDNPEAPTANMRIDGVTYCVAIDEALTLGEWIDTEEIQKGATNVISGVLSVVCRPVGEKYDTEITEARRAMFAALPMTQVLGVMAFFLQCKDVLERHTQAYMHLQDMADRLPRFTNLLQRRGGGIKWWRILRIIHFCVLTTLLRYRLYRYLRIYATSATKAKPKKHKTN